MKNRSFVTSSPKKEILQKYISYYYFTSQEKGERSNQYLYFPHFKNALTVYKGSNIEKKEASINIYSDIEVGYSVFYSPILKTPSLINIETPYDKIGVVFNPLGINNFVQDNLSSKTNEGNLRFDHFGDQLTSFLDHIYATSDIKTKVDFLDNFFVSQIQLFKQELIIKAVNLIHSTDQKYSVQELANELNTSRKTLLRQFNKHLCCSVKHYIDTVQFRRVLTSYQLANKKPKLTSLAYNNNYFDQSELIKHFKKLTGKNPLQLLNNIQHLGSEDTFWIMK